MEVQFVNLNKTVVSRYHMLGLGNPIEQEFSNLCIEKSRGYGFAQPFWAAHDALVWLWAKWHECQDLNLIYKTLRLFLKRGCQANNNPNALQYLREDHDSFLMQLAILSGSMEMARETADCVIEASPDCENYQYLHAWTGILKYAVLDNQEKMVEQHEIMKKWKSARIYPWPTNKLVETFVNRDYKAFKPVFKRSCERHWEYAKRDRSMTQKDKDTMILDVNKKYKHFMWPWVEATFAKLAVYDGAEIDYDSVWLPLDFLQATVE